MDRDRQLANVAFGGGWVDVIPERERLQAALDVISTAAAECMDRDARDPALRAALDYLADQMARGRMIADAYWRALGLDPGRRSGEVERLRGVIVSGVGVGNIE